MVDARRESESRATLIARAIKKGFIFKRGGKEMSDGVKTDQIDKMLFQERRDKKKKVTPRIKSNGIRDIQ